MTLNPRDFLTSVVTFVFSRSGVFDALSVNDNKGSYLDCIIKVTTQKM